MRGVYRTTTGGLTAVSGIMDRHESRTNAEALIAALRRNPEAMAELTPQTLRNYVAGSLPRSLTWMLRFPSLLKDLGEILEQAHQRRDGEGKKEKQRE